MDLPFDVFKQTKLGLLGTPPADRPPLADDILGAPLPEAVDWTPYTTRVRDQGQCSSCWAFATSASVEAANAIASGKLYALSDQQQVDCAPDPDTGCNPQMIETVSDDGSHEPLAGLG
jgi:KDEL-tailed cysteine endopeptidase